METKRSAGSLALKAVLALFFLFAVLLPLIRMLSNMATTDVGRILSQSRPFGRRCTLCCRPAPPL